jgi:transposase
VRACPVIAAIIGTVGDVARFADRDRFAACNGTAPIEVSSGERKIHRLSLPATGASTWSMKVTAGWS